MADGDGPFQETGKQNENKQQTQNKNKRIPQSFPLKKKKKVL
jgi:hypothetical protein